MPIGKLLERYYMCAYDDFMQLVMPDETKLKVIAHAMNIVEKRIWSASRNYWRDLYEAVDEDEEDAAWDNYIALQQDIHNEIASLRRSCPKTELPLACTIFNIVFRERTCKILALQDRLKELEFLCHNCLSITDPTKERTPFG